MKRPKGIAREWFRAASALRDAAERYHEDIGAPTLCVLKIAALEFAAADFARRAWETASRTRRRNWTRQMRAGIAARRMAA